MSATLRFSIVIPTREGAQTLRYTLQTCLAQRFDDYEVIVCDNCSGPATRAVVEAAASPRVRYVRAPAPLAMSSNWELAVSHAAGEFVTVLGDDDGLLPHALVELDRLLRTFDAKAVRWNAAFYLWPTVALPGQADYLRIPLGRRARLLDGRTAIASVATFQVCYTTLPMLYNAVVRRDVLDDVRRRAGRLFATPYPDVCSGFLVAHCAGTYASVDAPMTVAGLSAKSSGVGHHFLPGKSSIGREFKALNDAEGRRTHRLVPDLHVFPVVPVADCFLFAKEALFPDDDALQLDRKLMAAQCVNCLHTDSVEQWRQCLAAIRETFADDAGLLAWFDATLADHPPRATGPQPLRGERLGYDGAALHLDTRAFGVTDVAGAARLCEQVLGYARDGVPYELDENEPARDRYQDIRAAAALFAEILEKQRMIDWLAAAAEERLAIIDRLRRERELLRQRVARLEATFPLPVMRAVKRLVRRVTGSKRDVA